jgi:VanZ family protein
MGALARVWQKRRGFWLDVAPALLYVAVLFVAGLMPLRKLPGPDFALADKAWHLLAFAGLALLLARALGHFGLPLARAARDAALASALLGALLEIFQSFTRYRSADLADLLADALGAALAYLTLRVLGANASARGAA